VSLKIVPFAEGTEPAAEQPASTPTTGVGSFHVPLVGPERQDNEYLRATGYDLLRPGLGESLGAAFSEESSDFGITSSIMDTLRMRRAQGEATEVWTPYTALGLIEEQKAPVVTPLAEQQWKESKWARPGLSYTEGMTAEWAALLAERHDATERRKDILARDPGGVGRGGLILGSRLAAQLADPIGLASGFVPIVSQARYAAMASRLGRYGARAATGAIEGAVGQAMLEPFVYSASQSYQRDYDFTDSLGNVAMGGLFGAGLRSAAGAVGDLLARRGAQAHVEAGDIAVRQAAFGQEIDVRPALRRSEPTATLVRDEAQGANAREYRWVSDKGENLATIDATVAGDTLWIENVVGRTTDGSNPINALGPRQMRDLARQIALENPDIRWLAGTRTSGARHGGRGVDLGEGVGAKIDLDRFRGRSMRESAQEADRAAIPIPTTTTGTPDLAAMAQRRGKAEMERLGGFDDPGDTRPYPDIDDLITAGTAPSIQGHGIAGGKPEEQLAKLLTEGIDKDRPFHTGDISQARDSTLAAAGLGAKVDSPYVLVARPGENLKEDGIGAVIVSGAARGNLADLRRAFPHVTFLAPDEVSSWAANPGALRQTAQAADRAAIEQMRTASRAWQAEQAKKPLPIAKRQEIVEQELAAQFPTQAVRTAAGGTVRRSGPMDIVTWLRTKGGLKEDPGGEIASRDFREFNKGRVVQFAKGERFLGRLVDNERGMTLEQAATVAAENGYIRPKAAGADDVSPTGVPELMEAIERTLRAGEDLEARAWRDVDFEHVQSYYSAARGLDEEAHIDLMPDRHLGDVPKGGPADDDYWFDPVDLEDIDNPEALLAEAEEMAAAGKMEAAEVDQAAAKPGESQAAMVDASDPVVVAERYGAAVKAAAACMARAG
jgi:hypothetical protein